VFVVLDYDKLSKHDKDYLFGFGYRLNKALQKVFAGAPSVDVIITKEIRDDDVVHLTV